MTCEYRLSPVAGPAETEYSDESVQHARKHTAQNLPSLDIGAQAQAQYFVEEFFEQLGTADFGFQAFLSWLQCKVQDSGRGFGSEEVQQTQGVWHQIGLASESGEVQQEQLQMVIGLLLEKGMLVRGKSARWLQKENKALLQENARLRALLGLSGDDSLASMVERLRDKLSLAKAELEDRRHLVLELEAASHSEHRARLENSCSEAQLSTSSSHVHESTVHAQMCVTLAADAAQHQGTCGSVSPKSAAAALQDCLESASCNDDIDDAEDNIERAELRDFPSGLVENITSDTVVNTMQDCLESASCSNDMDGAEDNIERAELRDFPAGLVENITFDTVVNTMNCSESASCSNDIDGTEDKIERAELTEFPSGLMANITSDTFVNTMDSRCDVPGVGVQLSEAHSAISPALDHPSTSDSESTDSSFYGPMHIKVEDCTDSTTAGHADTAPAFNHSLAPTCESGTMHLEVTDGTNRHQKQQELVRAHVGVQATSESDHCPRDSSVQAGRSLADQVDVAVQSACIEKDIAIDFDIATWSPWSQPQGTDLVRDDSSFSSKSESCHFPAGFGYFDKDEALQKPEAGSQDRVLCSNCGELVDLTEDDAKVKRSVQEMLLDLEREKNAEIERLRKLLAARTFELDKFEQSTSRKLKEGQKVRALVKMKWRNNGKQMAVTWVGSTFKVNVGTIGQVCSLDPLRVSWPAAKHRTFIGEVAPDQVELESSDVHEGWSSDSGPAAPQPEFFEGSIVCVQGLNEAHLLNGQRGTCEQWDATAGRWQVRLDIGKVISVKPTNIRPAAFS